MLALKDLKLHKIYRDQLSGQLVLVIKISLVKDMIFRERIDWIKVECQIFNKVTRKYDTFTAKENQLTNIL